MIVYGIKNCNTMKKAFDWLDENHIQYEFKDYRKPGLSENELNQILEMVDLNTLVNKKSTTWRNLSDQEKEAVLDKKTAFSVLKEHPTLIKRPLIIKNQQAFVGFSEEAFAKNFLD